MRRLTISLVALSILSAACSDDIAGAPAASTTATVAPTVAPPSGLAVEIEMTLTQDDDPWTVVYEGWWDAGLAAGALTEDGEVMWHEHDGEITRTGVILPDLTKPWTRFDLTTWGSVGYDDAQFHDLGAVIGAWAAPSLESLVSVRDLVATHTPPEGNSTVAVDGVAFLDRIDEYVVRRSLVDCAGDVEIGVEVANGFITAIDVPVSTGFRLRDVHVRFSPWEGELPATPPEDDIGSIVRHREPGEPAPERTPMICDPAPRDPVTLDRAECPEVDIRGFDYWFTVVGRFGEATPAAPARLALSLSRVFELDELRSRLADHDLTVTGIGVQAPMPTDGVMNLHGLEVTSIPDDQAALEALVTTRNDRPIIAGAAVVGDISVEGTWGDIASLASSCDIYHAGPGNGFPARVDLAIG